MCCVVQDFCIFAPPTEGDIADSEVSLCTAKYARYWVLIFLQTIEVAWCTQARNNARVIPDGVLTGVSFLKTGKYPFSNLIRTIY